METMNRVFVYGALRRGALHAWRMETAEFLGEASVTGTMVAVDWYPGLVLEGENTIRGEVYAVSEHLLASLDSFEGIGEEANHTGEYERVEAEVTLSGEAEKVWVYEWQKGVEGYQEVVSGDWLSEPAARGRKRPQRTLAEGENP